MLSSGTGSGRERRGDHQEELRSFNREDVIYWMWGAGEKGRSNDNIGFLSTRN